MPRNSPALHDGLDLLSVPFKQWVKDVRGVNYGWRVGPAQSFGERPHNPLTIWQRLNSTSSLIGGQGITPDWPVFRGPPTVWQRLLDLDPV